MPIPQTVPRTRRLEISLDARYHRSWPLASDGGTGVMVTSSRCRLVGLISLLCAAPLTMGRIHWTAGWPERSIHRSNLNGGKVATLYDELFSAKGIGVDARQEFLFWTADGYDSVWRGRTDGSDEPVRIIAPHDFEALPSRAGPRGGLAKSVQRPQKIEGLMVGARLRAHACGRRGARRPNSPARGLAGFSRTAPCRRPTFRVPWTR